MAVVEVVVVVAVVLTPVGLSGSVGPAPVGISSVVAKLVTFKRPVPVTTGVVIVSLVITVPTPVTISFVISVSEV